MSRSSKKIKKNMLVNKKYASQDVAPKQNLMDKILLEHEKQKTIQMEARVKARAIVDEAMPNLRKLAREQVLRYYMTIVAFALHERFGFGKKRLNDFMSMFCRQEYILKDNMYKEDGFKIDEMYETLKEETKFDVFYSMNELADKYKMDDLNGTWKAYDLPD